VLHGRAREFLKGEVGASAVDIVVQAAHDQGVPHALDEMDLAAQV
jgi:hypothetical protein